jgi:hypothetical protein
MQGDNCHGLEPIRSSGRGVGPCGEETACMCSGSPTLEQ